MYHLYGLVATILQQEIKLTGIIVSDIAYTYIKVGHGLLQLTNVGASLMDDHPRRACLLYVATRN